jgi:DNA transformation protein and related proteins
MSQRQAYLEHVLSCLSQVAQVTYRKLFNGVGLYHQDVQFAIIINDQLYFRVDEYSRPLFEYRAMNAFQPQKINLESHFFQLPEEILTNPNELKHWLRIAVEAALNTGQDTFSIKAL